MGNMPISDRLIKGFKDGVVRIIGVAIALMISMNLHLVWYWRAAVFLGAVVVYWIIVWLLQLAWSRYRPG
jgi:Zn-dependent protease with chaperone function